VKRHESRSSSQDAEFRQRAESAPASHFAPPGPVLAMDRAKGSNTEIRTPLIKSGTAGAIASNAFCSKNRERFFFEPNDHRGRARVKPAPRPR